MDWGIDSGGGKIHLRNIWDVKSIHSAELCVGGKERAMDADSGNTGRDPVLGAITSSQMLTCRKVPLRHPNKNIGNLVGKTFLESRNFNTTNINL